MVERGLISKLKQAGSEAFYPAAICGVELLSRKIDKHPILKKGLEKTSGAIYQRLIRIFPS